MNKQLLLSPAPLVLLLALLVPSARADCTVTNLGLTPLNDLGGGGYKGFTGGLYFGGANAPPAMHAAAGVARATQQVRPRDAVGNVNTNSGKIVLLSIGMSNTTQEWASKGPGAFKLIADADVTRNPRVLIVDGAQGGQDAPKWTNAAAATWTTAFARLTSAGATPAQVQAIWIKQAIAAPSALGAFPAHALVLKSNLADILRVAKQQFPNLQLAFVSSRTRAYVTNAAGLNPEPFAYESGFSVKWLIEDQIAGANGLNFDPANGPVVAPWIAWGPYLWADGLVPRSDGLTWQCSDLESDFTHPSTNGTAKVGAQLLNFFKTDPAAAPWFYQPAPALNVVTNGSFAAGLAGWSTSAPPAVRIFLTTNTPGGFTGVTVSNRGAITHTISQNVIAALTNGAGANGRSYTARYRIRTEAPASTRLVLTLTGQGWTNVFIPAERVIRTNGVWLDARGTLAIQWTNQVGTATLAVEVGQRLETNYPPFTITGITMQSDVDGDGLADGEEIFTDPLLADTDGDGLPDEWELRNGFDAVGANDRDGDPDGDGFTNFQEFHAATNPRDPLSFPGRPANPNLSATARAVLASVALAPAGTNAFLGQHVSDPRLPLNEFTNFVLNLATNGGRLPALVEFQYDGNTNPLLIPSVNPLALSWWQSGGLVAIKFNPRNPWTGGPQQVPNPAQHGPVDLAGLLAPSNSAPASLATNLVANARYLAWLDEVAAGLAELQSNGVPVLYRTLAEQNGRWFWWGGRRQADFIALWRHAFDYFTHVKKLNNLIWVLESDAGVHVTQASDYYFPGADAVDVFGHNLYSDTWEVPFAANQLYRDYGKVYAIPQAGPGNTKRDSTFDNLTYATAGVSRFPRVSWIGVWNSFNLGTNGWQHLAIVDNANAAQLTQHPWSLTRDEVNQAAHLQPLSVSLGRAGALLEVKWQGGFLQSSSDLSAWSDVDRPTCPLPLDPSVAPALFFRVRD